MQYLKKSKVRASLFQVIFLFLLGLIVFYFSRNAYLNLQEQKIATGFSFLSQVAGFEISEGLIEYHSAHTYARALMVGLLNTVRVAIVGNVLALMLGTLMGIFTLSRNFLLSKVAKTYVETLRNIPLLLQLFFWYALFTEILPGVRNAYQFGNIFLCNRGLYLPIVSFSGGLHWDVPELQGFNFSGGFSLSPEYLSLLFGLVLYTGTFIAEIVRAGIQSVGKGQWEAAFSLGLSSFQTMKLVIIPQALRVIIPPLTGQFLNLTKNSSLAVAIAYPDFVSVANTSLNQTGQAIELILLIMLVYLTFSLTTSLFMNWYNKRVALIER